MARTKLQPTFYFGWLARNSNLRSVLFRIVFPIRLGTDEQGLASSSFFFELSYAVSPSNCDSTVEHHRFFLIFLDEAHARM